MHKFLALFLFLAIALFGANESQVFANFDKSFANATVTQKATMHENIKRIYVQAIIKNDINLKKESLERLITSAKALKLDSKSYVTDLNKLRGIKTTTQTTKRETPQQQSAKPLYMLSASKVDDTLVLKFNQSLDDIKLKNFSLNQKGAYRNVIDIEAILNGKSLNYKNFIVDSIRIAQFDKKTVRIVFSDSSQKTIKADVKDNTLIITTDNFISKENVKNVKTNTKIQAQTQSKAIPQTPATKKNKIIVIDPGHGGTDPGAVNGSLKEKVAVLAVSQKLGEYLQKSGYTVYFTRNNDKFINLRTRTKFANDKNADLFLSIHANAAPNAQKAKTMHGIETFFLSPARSERSKNAAALENKSDIEEMNYFSQQTFLNFLNREKIIASNKLGIDMQREILSQARRVYKATDGGVREAPFWVLVGALMPAVLIEIGYITHPTEGKMLYDSAYQNALAKGIANGVESYFAKNR
ncbi:N-acetylmuramoyl-L-alanine amidase [Campylobacter californiensis]|uniref:N-acetylmuramoyl-L-alanine amidase n=1 Tax=Campylobacter californiensis TaxID=1032243 RepID=UPI001475F9EF|nr:N-acetylmuramoyl-L-alanine amidase [Campylobacter sp. RM12916]MBE3609765.1 N-acetylmuramoyl-L-alanine amidase [Campylobacter sp. RM12916]